MRITTEDRIKADLEASLRARMGVDAGMTWGSFQRAMQQLGIRENDCLGSIEYGVARGGQGYLTCEVDDFGSVHVMERRS